jgi:subtilase family serine protease
MAVSLGLFALLTMSATAAERQVLHGHVPPAVAQLGLQPIGRLPATDRLHIAINLPLRNNESLSKLIQQVYDPGSTNFHRYLTPEQFTERFGPSKEDYQAILNFAVANGLKVSRPHPGRAIAGIDGSVEDIERALHVTMFQYQHPIENRRFFAPDVEPSLDLAVPVLAISGLNNFEVPHSNLKHAGRIRKNANEIGSAGSGTSGNLLGADFRNAYVPGLNNLKGEGQVVGLVEFSRGNGFSGGGGYVLSDVQLYESLTGAPTNIPLISVLGPNPTPQSGAGDNELSLDIDMVIAMAPGISNIVLYWGNYNATDEETYQEMAYPTEGEPRPNQISTSWSIDNAPASTNYLRELAVQGQSYFWASGDGAAWPVVTGNYPGFEWLTSVGGTDLSMNGTGASWQSESAWGGSAGGYLTAVPIPFFQKGVDMSHNQGSTQYRNCPDVAMAASGIEIVASFQPTNGPRQTGQVITDVGGTSAAAPLWAAFTALVNEQAKAQGKPPVGFLNPALYSTGQSLNYTSCFHDITNGNTFSSASPNAYSATNGYDLCTGWGTPAGVNLMNALVGLSGPVFVDFTYGGTTNNGSWDYPFHTLAQGINAVSNYGTIFLINGGSSAEKPFITKPMRITAQNGIASVGN